MPHQLHLNLQSRSEPRARAAQRSWAAWIALAVLVQVGALGLVPALAESARLGQAEERMVARHQGDIELQSELSRLVRAQSDPIYREREKKLLRTPDSALRGR